MADKEPESIGVLVAQYLRELHEGKQGSGRYQAEFVRQAERALQRAQVISEDLKAYLESGKHPEAYIPLGSTEQQCYVLLKEGMDSGAIRELVEGTLGTAYEGFDRVFKNLMFRAQKLYNNDVAEKSEHREEKRKREEGHKN